MPSELPYNKFYSTMKKVFNAAPDLEKIEFWMYGRDNDYHFNEEDVCFNGERWDCLEICDQLIKYTNCMSKIDSLASELGELLENPELYVNCKKTLQILKQKVEDIYERKKNSSDLFKASQTVSELLAEISKSDHETAIASRKKLFKKLANKKDPDIYNDYYVYLTRDLKSKSIRMVKTGSHTYRSDDDEGIGNGDDE